MVKQYAMSGYIEKMASTDSDLRFMALSDIVNDVKADSGSFTSGDENLEVKVLQNVLGLLEDKISEVKNQAVKCLGALSKVVRENQMELILDKLIDLTGSMKSDDETRDIASLALKTITSELPQDSKLAYKACMKLIPKLLIQLRDNTSASPASVIDILSILSTLVTRFPSYTSNPAMKPQPIAVFTPLLNHSRSAVQKRAIITLAQFLPPAPPEVFDKLLTTSLIPNLTASSVSVQRTNVQLIAAVTRYTPQKVAPNLESLVRGIFVAGEKEDSELREGVLQALETFVLRCPTEISPFLPSIISIANQLIKYDPNYAGDNMDDEDEDMDDVEVDSEGGLDDYSDDEDTSYKVRRSAAKLLAAVIGTRPELLQTLYRDVSPVLISRFGDREVSVKLEVWSTYELLLNQTAVYGGIPKFKESEATSPLKRKREDDDGMDLDGSPIASLRSQIPTLSKQLLNQLKGSKVTPAVVQGGFAMLIALLNVLPGVLSAQTSQILSISNGVLATTVSTSTAPLHVITSSFLSLYFVTHSPATFSSSINTITPTLLNATRQRHPRVASQAFQVFNSLLKALRPVKSVDWAEEIYKQAVARLQTNDTDSQVRQSAEDCIGQLWVCAPDVVSTKDGKEWDAILRSTERTENPIKVIIQVAQNGAVPDQWIDLCLAWIFGVLKRGGRSYKAEAFMGLDVLLKTYKAGISSDLPATLVPLLVPYLSTSDILLLSHAFATLSLILELAPQASYELVEKKVLRDIYQLSLSPIISGACLESLLNFYTALVRADQEIDKRIVPSLLLEVEKGTKANTSPGNVARCIAKVVQMNTTIAAGVIAQFTKRINDGKELIVVLSLLTLGELGRFISMANQSHIFDSAINFFSSESDDVRSAAAFATGNIAIGDMQTFLPPIIKIVSTDPGKRLLALHGLKEVVTHCSNAQLESVADALWNPLFDNSANSEEASRNVAASCLGKLTTTKAPKYLPQLQARLQDPSPAVRATVISALRYTLADSTRTYDDQLAPVIPEFLSLMRDTDLMVQRLTLSALNSAARNKPHLIIDHLNNLLPQLYDETTMKPNLIEVVQMGPWQHKVDKGLDARKAAYETMYTLLDTCLSKIDLHVFLERVLSGLKDDSDEIKVICHMMLFRMSQVAPAAVSQKLDESADPLAATMAEVAVEKNTVKQDLERASELQRSALRAIAALSKIASPGAAPRFENVVERVRGGQYSNEFKELITA